LGRPIAAPLERCAELLGIDLATVRELADDSSPHAFTGRQRQPSHPADGWEV
jgi:hypothetical protein